MKNTIKSILLTLTLITGSLQPTYIPSVQPENNPVDTPIATNNQAVPEFYGKPQKATGAGDGLFRALDTLATRPNPLDRKKKPWWLP